MLKLIYNFKTIVSGMLQKNSSPNYDLAKKKAAEIISDNFILEPPIIPSEIAKKYGIDVRVADFGEELRGICGFSSYEKNTIYVNSFDNIKRQSFTIAHELGHWILHKDIMKERSILYRNTTLSETTNEEKEANCFASHLLVPDSMFKELGDLVKGREIDKLSSIFLVSNDVIGFKIKNGRW